MVELKMELQGLDYTYPGGAQALHGIDLAIGENRRLALLGANGSGKTTLLLHLNGILRPDRGQIRLGGHPVKHSRRGLQEWRQRVGVVFQDPDDQLFCASVYQDISFGPLNLGLTEPVVRQRVEFALKTMDIQDLRDCPTHRLSFGQKKRVAIAGVIAMEPEILVLDEPTAGLDPQCMESLLMTLDHLHQAGLTLVLATHDMDLACGWADEIAILSAGRLVSHGDPEAVFQDQETLYHSGLRVPLLLQIGTKLQEAGQLAADKPLPRTRDQLLGQLSPKVTDVPTSGG